MSIHKFEISKRLSDSIVYDGNSFYLAEEWLEHPFEVGDIIIFKRVQPNGVSALIRDVVYHPIQDLCYMIVGIVREPFKIYGDYALLYFKLI